MGKSIGISAPTTLLAPSLDLMLVPPLFPCMWVFVGSSCWLLSCWRNPASKQSVLSGTWTVWEGDLLEPVAHGLGLSTSSVLG